MSPPGARGEFRTTAILSASDSDRACSLSPVPSPDNFKRHWELDEAPRSYYQDTEGTPEYDRRKAVRAILCMVSSLSDQLFVDLRR